MSFNTFEYTELDELRGDIPEPAAASPRTRVTSVNGLTGAIIIEDEDGTDYSTSGQAIVIPRSGSGSGNVTVDGSNVLISPTAAELIAANPELGGSGTDINVGNTIFVDSVYGGSGSGYDGSIGAPFDTFADATAAMRPGDCVVVRPGRYAESLVLPQLFSDIDTITRSSNILTVVTIEEHGLVPGCMVIHTGLDDLASPTTTFDGQFVVATVPTATSYTVKQSGADESYTGGGGLMFPLQQYHFETGAIIEAPLDHAAIFGYDSFDSPSTNLCAAIITGDGVFLSSGLGSTNSGGIFLELYGRLAHARVVDANKSAAINVGGYVHLRVVMRDSIISDGYDGLLGPCSPDTFISAPLIIGGNNPPGSGSDANGLEIDAPVSGTAIIEAGSIISRTAEAIKIAVNGQSKFGRLVIRSRTIEGVNAGVRNDGTAPFTQTIDIWSESITASAGQAVLDQTPSSDIIRIHGARIESTYNNAAGYAVKKTGSAATLVLDNCTLVPHATANESINSGGASRTVTCFGSKTAYAIGTGVTASGLLIDSDVK